MAVVSTKTMKSLHREGLACPVCVEPCMGLASFRHHLGLGHSFFAGHDSIPMWAELAGWLSNSQHKIYTINVGESFNCPICTEVNGEPLLLIDSSVVTYIVHYLKEHPDDKEFHVAVRDVIQFVHDSAASTETTEPPEAKRPKNEPPPLAPISKDSPSTSSVRTPLKSVANDQRAQMLSRIRKAGTFSKTISNLCNNQENSASSKTETGGALITEFVVLGERSGGDEEANNDGQDSNYVEEQASQDDDDENYEQPEKVVKKKKKVKKGTKLIFVTEADRDFTFCYKSTTGSSYHNLSDFSHPVFQNLQPRSITVEVPHQVKWSVGSDFAPLSNADKVERLAAALTANFPLCIEAINAWKTIQPSASTGRSRNGSVVETWRMPCFIDGCTFMISLKKGINFITHMNVTHATLNCAEHTQPIGNNVNA